ncbi:NYN domain-containing protein [Saccharopolyspora griseoalba]|uniref:NYN domain-containing protein n=1 Tax=Saccharopolyspora griseoalba TaxID=1431848 RepID=A0ABW2LTF7_9PSEU
MSSCVYVDAGYLLSAAAERVTGSPSRNSVDVDYPALVEGLRAHAAASSGVRMLRMYWYDAARHAKPDRAQKAISLLPQVKLRLGRAGGDGNRQKGVDIKLGLDMVLRAPRGIETIYLVSGDGDLVEFVEEAQVQGLQVVVLAAPDADGQPIGLSHDLHAAADDLELIDGSLIDATCTPRPTEPAPEPGAAGESATVPEADAATETDGARSTPSPAVIAERAQFRPALASWSATFADPLGHDAPVCTSSSDSGTTVILASGDGDPTSEELDEAMDRVIDRVLANYPHPLPEQRAGTQHHRVIPPDVDRQLLIDLSTELGVPDLTEAMRHRLRARFWLGVDQDR